MIHCRFASRPTNAFVQALCGAFFSLLRQPLVAAETSFAAVFSVLDLIEAMLLRLAATAGLSAMLLELELKRRFILLVDFYSTCDEDEDNEGHPSKTQFEIFMREMLDRSEFCAQLSAEDSFHKQIVKLVDRFGNLSSCTACAKPFLSSLVSVCLVCPQI